jgi:hypothetical protein
VETTTNRNSVLSAAANRSACTSMLRPDQSRNLVAVMSAMTVLTPGAMADPSCWPTRPALAMSISADSATTTAGYCSGSATGAIPLAERQPSRGPGFPRRPRAHRAGLRPAAWRGAARSPSLPTLTTFSRLTPSQPPPTSGGGPLIAGVSLGDHRARPATTTFPASPLGSHSPAPNLRPCAAAPWPGRPDRRAVEPGRSATAAGLGCRDRRAASHPKRARLTATRTIRAATASLARVGPSLGLARVLGDPDGLVLLCTPDPRAPIAQERGPTAH